MTCSKTSWWLSRPGSPTAELASFRLKSNLYAGIAILRRAHDPSAAKKKLAEAGYGGEPIVVIAPTELAGTAVQRPGAAVRVLILFFLGG